MDNPRRSNQPVTTTSMPEKQDTVDKKPYTSPTFSEYGDIARRTGGPTSRTNDPNGPGTTGGKSGF